MLSLIAKKMTSSPPLRCKYGNHHWHSHDDRPGCCPAEQHASRRLRIEEVALVDPSSEGFSDRRWVIGANATPRHSIIVISGVIPGINIAW